MPLRAMAASSSYGIPTQIFGPFKDKKTMENCNLRKYCCTFMVKMMMPVLGAASLNLQPINLQFVQKLAILQLYKIFLFHRWYDGGVKSIFAHCYIFLFLYIILLLLFWTFVMDGFFLVNCSMTGKTLSCHWSSKIRLLWWYCTAYMILIIFQGKNNGISKLPF